MEPIVLKVGKKTLEKMNKYYDSQMVPDDDGSESLFFKAQAIGCDIYAYTNGEVKFIGENALQEAKVWSKSIAKNATKKVVQDDLYTLPHIGAAETGSADYLGPICFVACYLNEEDIQFVKDLDISDLSIITNQEIVDYAKQLKDRLVYSLLILDNSHYNQMFEEGLNQANIRSKLFNQSIVNVMQKVKQNVKVKVINQYVSPKTYFNYLKNEVIVVKDLTFEKNAEERYMAVLASEILSRYAYLQYYSNMTKSLKMNLSRGTSGAVDLVAAKIAKKYGENMLTKVAKLNFPNTKKVKALLEKE